ARSPCIGIRGMRRNLLVTGGDEADATLPQRVQEGDHRVTAEAEDHFDAEVFQIIGQQISGDSRLRARLRELLYGCDISISHDFMTPDLSTILTARTRRGFACPAVSPDRLPEFSAVGQNYCTSHSSRASSRWPALPSLTI